MRHLRLIAVVFLSTLCVAQLPTRVALTSKPKYLKDVPRDFREFSEDELRQSIKVVAGRSHAVFGYNTPEVRVQLPKVSNSAYSTIDFGEGTTTLVDAKGNPVEFELERGIYDEEKFSDEIRFRNPNSEDEKPLAFARAKGTVKVKYPLAVKTLKLTPAQRGPKELGVKFKGPYVSFDEEAAGVADASSDHLKPIRAYDAAGHLLEPASYSETSTDADGVFRKKMAFYGVVARLELDTVEGWAELEIPFELPPAMLLPAGHEGEDPASYQQ
ncbi:MAG TPA: hypothetical protein VLA96_11560 [Terriglobales bacterium]|nr:hypothetical protein [Terriglobales bacterium]